MVLVDPLRTALVARAARRHRRAAGPAAATSASRGALVLVAIILVHAVVLFPAEIPNAVAGLVYGFAVALPMVLAAWVASGLIAYCLGVWIGRPLAVRLAGEERVETAEQRDRPRRRARAADVAPRSRSCRSASSATSPAPTRVPVWRYTWTSAVGVLPITAAATYLGHALDDFSLSDPLLWVAVGTLVRAGRADGDRRAADARSSSAAARARAGAAGRGSRRRSARRRVTTPERRRRSAARWRRRRRSGGRRRRRRRRATFARAVRVHHHDRPVAVVDVPRQALRARALRLRDPDVLGGGSGRARGAAGGAVVGDERVDLDVGERGVRGGGEVALTSRERATPTNTGLPPSAARRGAGAGDGAGESSSMSRFSVASAYVSVCEPLAVGHVVAVGVLAGCRARRNRRR